MVRSVAIVAIVRVHSLSISISIIPRCSQLGSVILLASVRYLMIGSKAVRLEHYHRPPFIETSGPIRRGEEKAMTAK